METIGISKAKAKWGELLKRVARGETIAITRYGRRVALLKPVEDGKKAPVGEVIEELKKFRRGRRLAGMSVKAAVEKGRC